MEQLCLDHDIPKGKKQQAMTREGTVPRQQPHAYRFPTPHSPHPSPSPNGNPSILGHAQTQVLTASGRIPLAGSPG